MLPIRKPQRWGKMVEKDILDRIKALEENIMLEWLSNGGTLTWAASDALNTGRNIRRFVSQGNLKGLKKFLRHNSKAKGIQKEMLSLARQWVTAQQQ